MYNISRRLLNFENFGLLRFARRGLAVTPLTSNENPRLFDDPKNFKPYVQGLRYTKFTNKLELINDSQIIPIYQILSTDGTLHDGCSVPFESDEVVKEHLRTMIQLNVWDNLFYNIQRQGRISFYIQNQGEEAMQLGFGLALKPQDHVFAQYRELGLLHAKGLTMDNVLAQLFGTAEDECKGRQMPISYSKRECNIHTISTPLTSQLPHASGAGYALKLQKADACSVGLFGEGAASEGDFHAALNFAAVRQSQTIFACRNNAYAISTPVRDQYAGDGIAIRGVAYGMPSIRVDGNDLFATYAATKYCRDYCVKHSVPICMEFMTYRVGHHSTSDESSQYRGPGENEVWNETGYNPIKRVAKYLEAKGLWSAEQEEALRKEATSFMLKKIKQFEKAKSLNIAPGIFDDVYDKETPLLKEQREELLEHLSQHYDKYNISKFEGME